MSTPKKSARRSATKAVEITRHWSYSAWAVFKMCRRRYMHQYVERRKTETTYAMARGTDAHSKAENYLIGKIKGLPPELNKLAPEFAKLKKMKPRVEEWLRLDQNWEVIPESNREKRPWFIGRVDALTIDRENSEMVVIDHKTGKFRPSHHEQGDLYATAVHRIEPEIETVAWEFWYLDWGEVKSAELSPSKLDELRGVWHERGMSVVTETEFHATPSRFGCQYCDFRTDKGGPCDLWKKA